MSFLYCPAYDAQLRETMDQIHRYWQFARIYSGPRRPTDTDAASLRDVPQGAPLYLLAHGHGELPLFAANQVVVDGSADRKRFYWSADEMASQLQSEGLTPALQNLHLLVCHAGESGATIDQATQLSPLFESSKKAQGREREALDKRYAKLVQNWQPPQHYASDRQVMPLAAQLYRELYSRGFTALTITAYKAPMSESVAPRTDSHPVFVPLLDLRGVGEKRWERVEGHESYKMIISAKLFRLLGWELDPNKSSDRLSCW